MKILHIHLKLIFLFTGILFLFFLQTNYTFSQEILDFRCKAEKLLEPDVQNPNEKYGERENLYARYCCVENNKESYIQCLQDYTEEGPQLFGTNGINFAGSDITLNRHTVPVLIRIIIVSAFGLFTITMIIMILFGLQKWIWTIEGGGEMKDVYNYIINGAWGTLFGIGSLIFVWIIFNLAGYKGNPFDFTVALDEILLISCESIDNERICKQYDISCNWENIDGKAQCIKNPNYKTKLDSLGCKPIEGSTSTPKCLSSIENLYKCNNSCL